MPWKSRIKSRDFSVPSARGLLYSGVSFAYHVTQYIM